VRIGDQRGVGPLRHGVGIELLHRDRHAVARVDLVVPAAGIAASGQHGELERRMPMDEPRAQRAAEPAGADDGDAVLRHGRHLR
jgi:hypothetical protein